MKKNKLGLVPSATSAKKTASAKKRKSGEEDDGAAGDDAETPTKKARAPKTKYVCS